MSTKPLQTLLLHQVQATLLSAVEQQGFPLCLLAEWLGVAPEPSHTALCQVWFTLLPLRLFQASGALFQYGAGAVQFCDPIQTAAPGWGQAAWRAWRGRGQRENHWPY